MDTGLPKKAAEAEDNVWHRFDARCSHLGSTGNRNPRVGAVPEVGFFRRNRFDLSGTATGTAPPGTGRAGRQAQDHRSLRQKPDCTYLDHRIDRVLGVSLYQAFVIHSKFGVMPRGPGAL